MYWIVGIIGMVFFIYWQSCRAKQITMFTHRSYERGWMAYVTDGRLTPSKVQALRSEGLEVCEARHPGRYSQVIIPAYSLTDMVIKAGEIGKRHGLMLLW